MQNRTNAGSPLRHPFVRWLQFFAGLFGFGLGIVLMIHSQLGLGPWDAFHVGLHKLTGISVGGASIAAGVVIVLGSRYLGVRPGIGTLVNMVMIGVFIDLLLPLLSPAVHWSWGLVYFMSGVGLMGLATGMYIAPGLGMGPRDGLMIGLSQNTGWSVRRIRTVVEMAVLGLGWSMGGQIGIGTVLFTLTIGPAMQWGMQLFRVLPSRPATAPQPAPRRWIRRQAA